jgi:hypothetical protein
MQAHPLYTCVTWSGCIRFSMSLLFEWPMKMIGKCTGAFYDKRFFCSGYCIRVHIRLRVRAFAGLYLRPIRSQLFARACSSIIARQTPIRRYARIRFTICTDIYYHWLGIQHPCDTLLIKQSRHSNIMLIQLASNPGRGSPEGHLYSKQSRVWFPSNSSRVWYQCPS